MAISKTSRPIFDYVKEHDGENITAADIAEALGKTVASVNGSVTSAFTKKGYMVREESEIELEDGTHQKVKFIRLTDEGRALDPDAEDAE